MSVIFSLDIWLRITQRAFYYIIDIQVPTLDVYIKVGGALVCSQIGKSLD